jgi:exosortase/archaeosortase family protein
LKTDLRAPLSHAVLRRLVLLGAAAVAGAWLAFRSADVLQDPHSRARLAIASLFAGILLLRPSAVTARERVSAGLVSLAGVGGAALALLGLVFSVHQAEWLGLLLVVLASLLWGLPASRSRDVGAAVFLVYWAHPLPVRLMGPVELALQRASVAGAEWLLHVWNVRVWADGMILRTGLRSFEVPSACSGMRTAMAVLLCALGTGFVFRFGWKELLGFSALGLAQGLLLNILRIAAMVGYSTGMAPGWSIAFLHDSTAIFLLGAILLIQVEAALWERWLKQRWREHRKRKRSRDAWFASEQNVLHRIGAIAFSVLLAAGIALLAYKHRPAHRAAMIDGVVEGLAVTDLEAAERATACVAAMGPAGDPYRASRARVLLLRGKAAEAIAVLDTTADASTDGSAALLRAWALALLGRAEEARACLAALPESARRHPGVCMAAAELAASRNDVEGVASNVVWAAQWPLLRNRIRALFPCLAGARKWRAMAEADGPEPYADPVSLRLAVTAQLLANRPDRAASILRQNRDRWERRKEFIWPMAALALRDRGGAWPNTFADFLVACLPSLSEEDLSACFDPCFLLCRPDLAWRVYERLRSLDARHPALALAQVRFAERWFVFRKQHVGLQAGNPTDTVDLRVLAGATLDLPLLRRFWRRVPLAEETMAGAAPDWRDRLIARCLADLAEREKRTDLPGHWLLLTASALEVSGRAAEAHAVLDRAEKRCPDRAMEIAVQRARLCYGEQEYQRAYEALRVTFGAWEDRLP